VLQCLIYLSAVKKNGKDLIAIELTFENFCV